MELSGCRIIFALFIVLLAIGENSSTRICEELKYRPRCPTTEGLYKGCYRDEKVRDLFNEHLVLGANNTIQNCFSECRALGYPFASVQNSTHCFCGHAFGRYGRLPENSCNMQCPGNQIQFCGGLWANSVYTTGYEGYAFAGVQYGRECFCGQTFGKYGSLPETDCDKQCAGDDSIICGGKYANSVYTTGYQVP